MKNSSHPNIDQSDVKLREHTDRFLHNEALLQSDQESRVTKLLFLLQAFLPPRLAQRLDVELQRSLRDRQRHQNI